MALKIGDKVRFLDAVGGGVVTAFKGKDQVVVLEDDGFETPALIRQCVVVNEPEMPKAVQPVVSAVSSVRAQAEESRPAPVKSVTPRPAETREGEEITLCLAYLPVEGSSFIEGRFECFLINDSNYTLLFHLSSCEGKNWKTRFAGEIEPNSRLFLEEFGKESIPELEKLGFQATAFKREKPYAFKNALSVEIRVETVKFYKVHCFRENDYFEDDALLVPLVRRDVPEKTLMISAEDIQKSMMDKQPEKIRVSGPLPKKAGPLEVDLHINELLDTTTGMDNAAILNHQLDVFRKIMDEHQQKKGFRIVFIHGKGDGVLRAAILNELRTRYKTCRSQDASFREYGFGATLVTIG